MLPADTAIGELRSPVKSVLPDAVDEVSTMAKAWTIPSQGGRMGCRTWLGVPLMVGIPCQHLT